MKAIEYILRSTATAAMMNTGHDADGQRDRSAGPPKHCPGKVAQGAATGRGYQSARD